MNFLQKTMTLSIATFLILQSCTDSTPDCITEKISDFQETNVDRGFTFIYEFQQDGSTFYIFDSGIAFDATAEVVNDQCEVVCTYGGFRPASPLPCDEYQEGINNAKQIWPE